MICIFSGRNHKRHKKKYVYILEWMHMRIPYKLWPHRDIILKSKYNLRWREYFAFLKFFFAIEIIFHSNKCIEEEKKNSDSNICKNKKMDIPFRAYFRWLETISTPSSDHFQFKEIKMTNKHINSLSNDHQFSKMTIHCVQYSKNIL